MSIKARLLTCLLALGILPSAMADTAARAAPPYPSAQTPKAVDEGALAGALGLDADLGHRGSAGCPTSMPRSRCSRR